MARTDAMVLGAGIVGTSIALHLARRGLHVALIDRRGPGEETSFGNAGIIGSTIYPAAFPRRLATLIQVALQRVPQANYHLRALPRCCRGCSPSGPPRRRACAETARLMRPLLARAVAEHAILLGEAGATRYLRQTGFLTLYRSEQALSDLWVGWRSRRNWSRHQVPRRARRARSSRRSARCSKRRSTGSTSRA